MFYKGKKIENKDNSVVHLDALRSGGGGGVLGGVQLQFFKFSNEKIHNKTLGPPHSPRPPFPPLPNPASVQSSPLTPTQSCFAIKRTFNSELVGRKRQPSQLVGQPRAGH